MSQLFIAIGGIFCLIGVLTRSLSSHAIHQLLLERGKLDNFNLAADYLLFHGLALIAMAILGELFPETSGYQRAGYCFIAGSILFQFSVLAKSLVSISPFGFLTPVGGAILMAGWLLLIISAFRNHLLLH